MGVLPECLSVQHTHSACGDKQALDSLGLEVQLAISLTWVLGIEPSSSEKQPVPLTIKQSLQRVLQFFAGTTQLLHQL